MTLMMYEGFATRIPEGEKDKQGTSIVRTARSKKANHLFSNMAIKNLSVHDPINVARTHKSSNGTADLLASFPQVPDPKGGV